MKTKLFIILSIFMYSCTKDICINNSNFSCYDPEIILVDIDSPHILSEQDTTFLEINVWVDDREGLEDIDQVIYFVKREEFFLGESGNESGCLYEEINDSVFWTDPGFVLSNTLCYGDYDADLEKVCEELTQEECEDSDECLVVDSSEMLYYTLQTFKPFGYPDCGGFGRVKFQFQITDNGGLQDFSEEIIVEITP